MKTLIVQAAATLRGRAAALKQDKRGVTALEYGLIAAIMSVVIITGFTALSGGLTATLARITKSLV